jgi:hypothetical protein
MLATHRPIYNAHPSISYPIPITDFPPRTPSPRPQPMSLRSQRGRRPSLSSPMSWLTRSSSTSSNTPPARISHKKSSTIASIRHGNFGSGVTVVRTPQEALAGSGVAVEYASDQENEHGELKVGKQFPDEDEDEDEDEYEETGQDGHRTEAGASPSRADHPEAASVPPAYSPPRSSLPLSKSTPSLPLKDSRSSRPPRPAPAQPIPSDPSVLLTQKKLPPPPLSTLFPAVPPFPPQLATPTSLPQFECILLSPVPSNAIDFSKVLVTVETCTSTHRTTFSTLTSRPSHLANYLNTLFSDVDDELEHETMSLGSPAENGSFNSIFHNHLTSSGVLSQSTYHVHVFLDRPSSS